MRTDELSNTIIDCLFEGAYIVDLNRKILSWNKSAEHITGYSKADVIDKNCFNNILKHVDESGKALCFNGCPLYATMQDSQIREVSVFLQHKNGHRVPVIVKSIPLFNNVHELYGSLEIFTENKNDEHLKLIIEKFHKESNEDALTGIPNRRYAEAILESRFQERKAIDIEFGVLFIDIDHFKRINDTHGHENGDKILKIVVDTMKSTLRKSDFVGRWGGEEFIVIVTNVNSKNLISISEKIRKLVEASVLKTEDTEISATISIGATMANEDDTIQSCVKRSDDLMYKSKLNGRNKVTFG